MAATKLQANWTAVSHNSASITRVNNVTFTQGGQVATYSGDGDKFPTVAVNLMNAPRATVTSSDPAALMAIAPGTTGAFTATHNDAKGAVGGAIVYTLANAVAENVDTSGAHASFGTASLSLIGVSADGTTNPLSFTRS